MCHQKEIQPQPKFKKATFVDVEGQVLAPVKVIGPVLGGEIRVYGNPSIVPGGAAWLRFKEVYAKDGTKVF
ncbi:hypothetical protein HYW44_04430 [Candidatus Daviesbacteria bacterium]|nr:hypothetical protein [Candidatus Daviesbacteria bacterium]